MLDFNARVTRQAVRQRDSRNLLPGALPWLASVRGRTRRAPAHVAALSVGLAAVMITALVNRPGLAPAANLEGSTAEPSATDSIQEFAAEALDSVLEASPSLSTYVVEPGDTLRSLAERFGLSVATIAAANTLTDPDAISVGQQLVMLPTSGVLHTINQGETLGQVASRYGVEPAQVAHLNQLTSVADKPVLGQKLVVPGIEPTIPEPKKVDGPAPAKEPVVYEVQEGDSLRFLAENFGVSTRTILQANSLDDPDLIRPGTRLKVPPAEEDTAGTASRPAPEPKVPQVYEVQEGDSLRSLADQFGVSPRTILLANNLDDPDLITVGTKLKVLPTSGVEHEVGPGESLADIAAAYRVDLGPIIDYNGLTDPNVIAVGKKILIPGAASRATVPTAAPPAPRVASPPAPVLSAPAPRAAPAQSATAQAAAAAAPVAKLAAQLAMPASAAAPTAPAPRPAAQTAPRTIPQAAVKPAAQAVASIATPPAPALAPAPSVASGGNGGLASIAMKHVGSRYVFGGTSPAGFDCSGFVWYVHKAAGINVSRGLAGQLNSGARVSRDSLQPGDSVFFANTYMPGLSHAGIYVGGGQFVHAIDERSGVGVSSMGSSYWAGRFVGASRAR
jgi:LysM repeat protein